jgi:predicted ArsR family transcriptional regulator
MSDAWAAPRPRLRPDDERALEHAALASPVRLQLLDELTARRGPSHVEDLAVALDLHPSTVRGHLIILQDAGFVDPVVEHTPRPGRPRVLYRASSRSRHLSGDQHGYRTLASILIHFLDLQARDPAEAGEHAGRAWATRLTRDEPRARRREEALPRVCELLTSMGFTTEVEDDPEHPTLIHRNCPFACLVDEHSQVVCGLHRGLIQGLLEGLGAPLETIDLGVSIHDRSCLAHLRVLADDAWR